jgi:ketosteroid isomerase-like protein
MSRENVQIVRGAIDAFNRGERDAWLAFYDPEFVNVPPKNWPESAPVSGSEAAWDFYVATSEPWEGATYEIGELIDGDDTAAFEQRAVMRGQASGATVAWSYWQALTFRRGRILRSEWYSDRDEALAAAAVAG